jgi:hypothetical protein
VVPRAIHHAYSLPLHPHSITSTLQREKYFAQPPIELLRQWFDHGGWYERKPPCPFRQIIDTQFVGSMGPPGGGRNPVTNRLLRHFNFLSFTEMSDESISRIFTTILGAFFRWVCTGDDTPAAQQHYPNLQQLHH